MHTNHNPPAPQDMSLVLLSGGLDSAVVLALAAKNSMAVHTLTFSYGQKHSRELNSARDLADRYQAHGEVVPVALERISGLRPQDDVTTTLPELLPQTWKPGRNIIFLAQAGAYAADCGIHLIAIGAHQEDQPGYPDCTHAFLLAMEHVLQQGLSYPIAIWAPLLHLDKTQIVELGQRLHVPFNLTWSCYEGGETKCNVCDACIRRAAAFKANGLKDPVA